MILILVNKLAKIYVRNQFLYNTSDHNRRIILKDTLIYCIVPLIV
jgi:hypothetical protein